MPYATGTANSATDLRNAIVSAATANGWAWDSTHNVLSKGAIYGQLTISGLKLGVKAALGHTGGTLTTPAPLSVGFTNALSTNGNTPLTYPVTYHIFMHTSPDDIIVAVNYQTHWWQWLALGQAVNLGVPGSAIWQWGTADTNMSDLYGADITASGGAGILGQATHIAPFWAEHFMYNPTGDVATANSAIHLALDTKAWWTNQDKALSVISAGPLLETQPNAWNGEAVLVRMYVTALRPAGLWSHVAELPHLRMTRNDHMTDSQILTLGPDKWFIAPAYRRNTAAREGTTMNYNHSGTIAMAVRYDGP